MQLPEEFRAIIEELEEVHDSPFFITGKAGTGKSTLLRAFRKLTKKRLAVLAPTGIAALQIQGQTIHSFFGLPARPWTEEDLKPRRSQAIFKALDALVIDEVSMLRADQLDGLDLFLRRNRQIDLPFGGVQLIFFGDLFQLPPVIATQEEARKLQEDYESPYFFSAHALRNSFLCTRELREVFRQSDRNFINLLDAVRSNCLDWDEFETLNERVKSNFETPDYYITLSARNREVDAINKEKLEALPGQAQSYIAQASGMVNSSPAESPLKLKLGAQVMLLVNNHKKGYVNGNIGKVLALYEDSVDLALPNEEGGERIVRIEAFEWEMHKHELQGTAIQTRVVGQYKQLPLRLAWAISIHKSQGQSFDKVCIDLGSKGAFEYGQTYVALSRCRSLEGIVLKHPLQGRDIRVDPQVVDFHAQQGRY